ncbi:MAG: hypothetical protein WBD48_10900, partial [Pseudolabrys sp.]
EILRRCMALGWLTRERDSRALTLTTAAAPAFVKPSASTSIPPRLQKRRGSRPSPPSPADTHSP